MCYGMGCIYEDSRGECRKSSFEACPNDDLGGYSDPWGGYDDALTDSERKEEEERVQW